MILGERFQVIYKSIHVTVEFPLDCQVVRVLDFAREVLDSCRVIAEIFDLVPSDTNPALLARPVNHTGSDSIHKVAVDELELELD